MAFKSNQTDYYGLGSTTLILTSSDENKSVTVVQARNEKGDFVAQETCGETSAPNCSFVLKGDTTLASVKLGSPNTSGDKKYAITSITIDTSAGSPPSVSVSGEEVPSNSTQDCYYDVPSATIKACHHAQILWGCITESGDTLGAGIYLTQSSYSAQASLTKATKDGDTLAYDVIEGQITATLTFQGTGAGTPSCTPGSDWVITSPLTKSSPDADYPTWTITLSKALKHATGVGQ